MQHLLAYVTSEVLDPYGSGLESRLAAVETVDEVLKLHEDFLDTCLKESMLTNEKLLKVCSIRSLFFRWEGLVVRM